MSLLLLHRAATTTGYRTPAHKLVMMCLADSAGDGDHIAYPGQDAMLAWAGIRRSHLYDVIKELREDGLLEQVTKAARGHLARYRVWPQEPTDDEREDGSAIADGPPTGPQRVHNGSTALPPNTLNRSRVRSTPNVEIPVVQTAPTARARDDGPTPRPMSESARETLRVREEKQAARARGIAAAERRRQETAT